MMKDMPTDYILTNPLSNYNQSKKWDCGNLLNLSLLEVLPKKVVVVYKQFAQHE